MTDKQIGELIVHINNVLCAGEYEAFDYGLQHQPVKDLELVHMIAILRTSFPFRHLLPHYGEFLAKAKAEVQARGRELGTLFKGLDKPSAITPKASTDV